MNEKLIKKCIVCDNKLYYKKFSKSSIITSCHHNDVTIHFTIDTSSNKIGFYKIKFNKIKYNSFVIIHSYSGITDPIVPIFTNVYKDKKIIFHSEYYTPMPINKIQIENIKNKYLKLLAFV